MYDVTIGNQLAGVPTANKVLDRPQAYPYLGDDGNVYDIANFEQCANYRGHSSLDWEPNVLLHQTAGTVAISSGVVTLSDATFNPAIVGSGIYRRRFYVNGQLYFVQDVTDSTHLTLTNTSVNASAGTSYKYAIWSYRETDPKFAVAGEMEGAYDEFAHALAQVESMARANSARLGIYDLAVPQWRRPLDILDDYENWKDDLATCVNYVTAEGWTLVDFVRRLGGKIWWTAYIPEDYLLNDTTKARWRLRNQRLMEALRELKVPNAPLFRGYLIDADEEETPAPMDYLLECIADAEAYQPGDWAFWGVEGEYDSGFISSLSTYTTALPRSRPPINAIPGII